METLKLFIIMLVPFLMLHFLFKWGLTSALYKNRDLAKEDLEKFLVEEEEKLREKELGGDEVLDLIISEAVAHYTNYFDLFLCAIAIALTLILS